MGRTTRPLLLGTAKEKITPRLGVPLVGYPQPRPNTGVAKDLFVRAALFGIPGSKTPIAALFVLDTINIRAALVHEMRSRIVAHVPALSPESIMIAATHTHSGPRLYEYYKEGQCQEPDRETVELTVEACVRAAVSAWKAPVEVSGRIGLTEAYLGTNRRVVDTQGKATNIWEDPEGNNPGYFNPMLRFIVFDNAETGKPYAIFDHYGCHPVVGGWLNTRVSPDYPGWLVEKIEAKTGVSMAIHITGAAANINPRGRHQEDATVARVMGEALADEVLECIELTRPLDLQPVCAVVEPFKIVLGPEALPRLGPLAQDSPQGKEITTETQVLRLGDLAFVTTPGELFAEIGVRLQNISPFRHTIVVSNANDSLGYLVTEAAYREGGYERNLAPAPDIEPRLVEAARRAMERAAKA